mmetsp:Transcript_17081/g.44866  ORF Transcript_17081/g.44866 Transcript_17081/m.44866 type:complete len:315 (+) Transcript_17081:598-1542(+)
MIGSRSSATRRAMRSSRIMKFVAHVSSSNNNVVAPASTASQIAAACDVLPDASDVLNLRVKPAGRPGTSPINDEMSTLCTLRPSSARTLTQFGSLTHNSRPSPGTLSKQPTCSACNSVDLPWKPPPQISDKPLGNPKPVTPFTSHLKPPHFRASNATAPSTMGRSSFPARRARRAPSPMNATRPFAAKASRKDLCLITDAMCVPRSASSRDTTAFNARSNALSQSTRAHQMPSMLRPDAGSATVNRTSTPPLTSTRHAVRSSTNCEQTAILNSPPFLPPQPPVSVRRSSPAARASSKNRRAIQSPAAMRETFVA